MASESVKSTGDKLFDYLKMKFRIDSGCKVSCSIPNNTWKEYKKQWVVLTVNVSPSQCYISYCVQEDYWLSNQKKLPRITLDNFHVERPVPQGRNVKNVLGICFDHYTLLLEYESTTKLQMWLEELEKIKNRTLAELVRSPEHPEREKEYVIDLQQDRITFYPHKLGQQLEPVVEFEWKLDTIRRAKYHKHIGKVEVEVGRAASTGEGHFYFIGPQMINFFHMLKNKIESLSQNKTLMSPNSSRKSEGAGSSLPHLIHCSSSDYNPATSASMSSSSREEGESYHGDSPSSTGGESVSSNDHYPFRPPLSPPLSAPPLSPPLSHSVKLPFIPHPPLSPPLGAGGNSADDFPPLPAKKGPLPELPSESNSPPYIRSKSVVAGGGGDYTQLFMSTRQRPSEYDSVNKTPLSTFRINNK